MNSKFSAVAVGKTPSSSIFEVAGVSKWFVSPDKREKIYAVRDATLSITRGAITGIVGESGSGKTTLLYLLGGLYKPNEGKVSYCPRNQGLVSLRNLDLNQYRLCETGWVFQQLNLINHLPVWKNVALPLFLQGFTWSEAKPDAMLSLRNLGMEEKAYSKSSQLSGGEQQRVAICRALVKNPQVILADEPTGNLDGYNTERFLEILKKINERGVTVIIVTHDVHRVTQHCDEIFICDKRRGNIVIKHGGK